MTNRIVLRILVFVLQAAAFGGKPGTLAFGADTVSESFLHRHHNQAIMSVVGESKFIEPTDAGLQIRIKPPGVDNTGIRYAPQLIGDFTITVRASLVNVRKPSSGYGTGIAILIEDGLSYGASLQRVVFPDHRQCLVSHHYTVDAGKYDHQAKEKKFGSTDVILQIERKGANLIYRAAEKGSSELQELDRVKFTDRPIPVTQVYAQTGGAANEVCVRIESIEIIAEELLRPGQRSKTADSKKGPVLILVLLGAGILFTGITLLRRRRPETTS
ncbi:MAG: hypothetical protein WCK86_06280 [Planctomycetia bacterium]